IPHLSSSRASGAALRMHARISRSFFRASFGAALMYSATVLGRDFFGVMGGGVEGWFECRSLLAGDLELSLQSNLLNRLQAGSYKWDGTANTATWRWLQLRTHRRGDDLQLHSRGNGGQDRLRNAFLTDGGAPDFDEADP